MKRLPQPKVIWDETGTPASEPFGDIYYAPGEGLGETRHVFLSGTGLPGAWTGRDSFVVFETGFGTGLNFLATWQLWREHRARGQHLHFVSVEGFPLAPEDLSRALAPSKEISELAEKLLSHYPPRVAGNHRITFPGEGLTLTLIFDEAGTALTGFEGEVDAWFLDGFAPSKNPDMWSESLFAAMVRCSALGARAATFTVAGAIRRGLEGAGFKLERRPGYGRKRECLGATFVGGAPATARKPWFSAPRKYSRDADVAVIGAGIAGATVAHVLSREGLAVSVFDKAQDIASEASGNPLGLVNPGFSLSDDPIARFREGAALHAVQFYDGLGLSSEIWSKSGVLQIAHSAALEDKQAQLAELMGGDNPWFETLSPQMTSKRLGFDIKRPSLFVREAGYLAPKAICAHLLSGIALRLGTEITQLMKSRAGWTLFSAEGEEVGSFDIVVLANAFAASAFPQTDWLPLIRNRGQITRLGAGAFSSSPHLPVSFGGYLAPPVGAGPCTLGATYRELEEGADPDFKVRDEDHAANLKALFEGLGLATKENLSDLEGRVSLRVRTPDRLPVVGPATVAETCRKAYGTVRHGNRFEVFPSADYHDGLFLSCGYGSRGFQWAPLAAEILASEILGLPMPVSREELEIIHPSRFILRDLRRA